MWSVFNWKSLKFLSCVWPHLYRLFIEVFVVAISVESWKGKALNICMQITIPNKCVLINLSIVNHTILSKYCKWIWLFEQMPNFSPLKGVPSGRGWGKDLHLEIQRTEESNLQGSLVSLVLWSALLVWTNPFIHLDYSVSPVRCDVELRKSKTQWNNFGDGQLLGSLSKNSDSQFPSV